MLEGKAFYQDHWIDSSSLYLHISDLSIHRAYAVVDYLKEVHSNVPWIDDYLDRFIHSLELSDISIEYSKEELHDLIYNMLKQNGFGLSGIKLLATGGYSPDGRTVPDKSNFCILNYKGRKADPKVIEQGITLIQDEFQRPNPEIKTIQYFNSVQLHKKMKKFNTNDVLYHFKGLISETSRANFYIIKDGRIKTPGGDVFSGITRRVFIENFKDKYPIDLEEVPFSSLETADEAFLTSTTRGIVPVVRVENILIASGKVGPITRDLIHQFKQLNL